MTTSTTKEQGSYETISIDRITLGTVQRPNDPQTVAMLKESIARGRLLHPITVKKGEDDTFELVTGYHRLLAIKELGWTEALVLVVEQTALESEWTAIQENLHRKNLTALDLAWYLGRSKEIYEELHPEAGHGKKTKAGQKEVSFLEYEANAHHRSRASIGMHTYIYNHLDPSLFDELRSKRGSEFPGIEKLSYSLKDLNDLARQSRECQQETVKFMAETGLSYPTTKNLIVRNVYGLKEKIQESHEDEKHEKPEMPIKEQDDTEKTYIVMQASVLEYKEPTEENPDPELVRQLEAGMPKHVVVKPGTRIGIKQDMVVITILKSDPLLSYGLRVRAKRCLSFCGGV